MINESIYIPTSNIINGDILLRGFYLYLAGISSPVDFIVDNIVIVEKGELICSYDMLCSKNGISVDMVQDLLVKLVLLDYIKVKSISSKKSIFSIKFPNRIFLYQDEYIKYCKKL